MSNSRLPDSTSRDQSGPRSRLPWLLAAGCVLITLIGLLLPPLDRDRNAQPAPAEALGQTATTSLPGGSARPLHAGPISEPGATAEQIVTNKVAQFARSRRAIARALARNFKVEAPAEVERFFDFAEAGRWDDLKSLFKSMLELRKTSDHPKGLEALWPALHETYGVAEAAHDWPAQKLLDYGQAVLGSLRPGMVYVGGTDPGRFIPTLLNETTDGERHVVLTQNAFADGTYLDYVDFLYADRLATLTKDDSQQAFQDYLADATKRAQHDQQFPYQPRQLKPGEDVRLLNDGGGQRVQVSGQVAVMAINEKLLQTLMGKNPDVSFALEESFPLKSTYADAAPLGPLMELRAQPAQNALTAESAAQTVDYWRATAQQLLSDPEASASPDTLKAYAKLAVAQGNLLRDRKYDPEAEQAYRLATELAPASPEAVFNYVQVLTGQNRIDDALSVAEAATKLAPENPQFVGLLEQLRKVKKN